MASLKSNSLRLFVIFFILLCMESKAKQTDNETSETVPEVKLPKKQTNDGAAMLFADEMKQTLEKYLFGMCPQTFKMSLASRKNVTAAPCELDPDQEELAGRFATLALRVHSAARADCSRLGAALANTLGELARTAANRHAMNSGAATNEANKKRKLSKSQKAKIQAKQRTALAVKKKAAAVAAAAAAKMAAASS